MAFDKPIRRIAIVGTRVIVASRATGFLARGFGVTATDPAANDLAQMRDHVLPDPVNLRLKQAGESAPEPARQGGSHA